MAYELPWEAVEAITLDNLKKDYEMAKEDLDNYYHNKGYMHRDDVESTSALLHHLKPVIEYCGGTVD